MPEPHANPRWRWWIATGLTICLVTAALRVGLPLYRRNCALALLKRQGFDVVTISSRPEWLRRHDHWGLTAGVDSVVGVWDPYYLHGLPQTLSQSDIDELLAQIRVFSELKALGLRHVEIEGQALQVLAYFPNLEHLALAPKSITGDGLKHVAGSSNLRVLDLTNSNIDDAGLAHLAGLTKLESLYLDHTRVTDGGLKHLARLPNLRELSVSNTSVTEAGLDEILKSHPGLSVSDD